MVGDASMKDDRLLTPGAFEWRRSPAAEAAAASTSPKPAASKIDALLAQAPDAPRRQIR